MHLEVAAVDHVVGGDDQLGELGVAVLDRLDRAVELGADQVQALERPDLEPAELLLILDADAVGHQPTFPVT